MGKTKPAGSFIKSRPAYHLCWAIDSSTPFTPFWHRVLLCYREIYEIGIAGTPALSGFAAFYRAVLRFMKSPSCYDT